MTNHARMHLRDAVLEALAEAYEDAGMQGLCGEGRQEAAVGAVRALIADLIDGWTAEPASQRDSYREDAKNAKGEERQGS